MYMVIKLVIDILKLILFAVDSNAKAKHMNM